MVELLTDPKEIPATERKELVALAELKRLACPPAAVILPFVLVIFTSPVITVELAAEAPSVRVTVWPKSVPVLIATV